MTTYVIGLVGSGKSTYATKLARQAIKKGQTVYSMTPIAGCRKLEKEDFCKWKIENALVLVDESGLFFGNRDWSNTPKNVIRFFKLHRHYNCDVYILSQECDDTDKKLKGVAARLLIISPLIVFRRSTICSIIREVKKKFGIDEKHQLIEMYYIKRGFKMLWCPRWWKYFNSFDREELPDKTWETFPEPEIKKRKGGTARRGAGATAPLTQPEPPVPSVPLEQSEHPTSIT